MSDLEIWTVVALVSLGAFASRAVFLLMPSRIQLPGWFWDVLDLLPAAAFAALVAPAVLAPDGAIDLVSARTASALAAVAIAWWTDSMALTLLAGLLVVILLS